MTAGLVLVTAAGLLVAGGAVAAVCAWRGVPVFGPHRPRRAWRPRPVHLLALGAGVLVLVVTGWPVAALAAAGAVVFVPAALGGGTAAAAQIRTADAVAAWTRRLSDLIGSGAAGSVPDAVAASADTAPPLLAGPVRALAARMGMAGVEPALLRFSAEAGGGEAAQTVAGLLIQAEQQGTAGLAGQLAETAAQVEELAGMLREVEAERAKPRGNAKTIVIVTAVLIAGMMLFTRSFLAGYSSPAGQLLLAGVAGVFAVALRWMRRLADPPEPVAVLAGPRPAGGADGGAGMDALAGPAGVAR